MRDTDRNAEARRSSTPTPAATVVAAVFVAAAAAACEASAPAADVGDRNVDDATRIVLLGTSHFAGSATDERTSEIDDVLSDARQRELDRVARRIADWNPDRFFVECTPDRQPVLDSLYRTYRSGDYDPTRAGDRGEIRQLGLRAADAADLERMECADARGVWLGARARQVAEEHNPEVLADLERHADTAFDRTGLLAEHTIGEFLVELNSEARLWDNHRAYIDHYVRMGSFDGVGTKVRRESELAGRTFALGELPEGAPAERIREAIRNVDGRIVDSAGPDTDYVIFVDREIEDGEAGADSLSVRELGDLIQRRSTTWVGFPDHHIGADLVGEWYKRNLRIYANVWRAAAPDDERVVLMMGQGHIWTLRQFFRENPDFRVVPVDRVL